MHRIVEKKSFAIVGQVKRLKVKSTDDIFSDLCGEVWDEFFNSGTDKKLALEYKLYREPLHQVGLYRDLDNGEMEIAIGAEGDGNVYPGLGTTRVPDALWAVVDAYGKTPDSVGENWTRATTEWLPQSGYQQAGEYSMDSYPAGDSNVDDYHWYIWIPVKKV
jgi:AraC family transcriptional regulator